MEGARIGPYRVLGDLGSGGMGRVYRAEVADRTPGLETGCHVALKVIHAHLLDTPGFFQRFLREADIGRAVEHENVVRTYLADALLHEGVQQNFLVMEYVEGQTLRALLEELDRVPEELCRHIGREIAKGLEAIHAAGVVHRDLKPENVLITEAHEVKIMDLGVARLQDEAIRLSQTGVFVGSLEYAAPEQFRSGGDEADGRSDLHGLGVMLYELSTGQHPYRDDDARKVLRNILDVSPRKAGEVNPQLSPFFEETVQTLLAKDRERRFASAADLATILEKGEESTWWKEHAKALRLEMKRPLRRIRIPRETALYGRDGDLARLQALYEKARAGDGQVLLIEGEAGIGKTRLVDEFIGRLRGQGEDLNFLFGSYPPGGAATAAGAFSTAYREYFGEAGSAPYLGATPILVPAFDALLKGEPPANDEEPLTKDSLQTVFVHATRALAAERATIVLIDDLHFAPEEGRALFTSLALAVPEHQILLIGTMRPGVPETWTANVTRLDHAEQRSLSRLGPKDLSRLLEDAFRSERLAEELGYQISVKSDGNPFFAFEIIRGLREGQFISQQEDGTWITTRVIQDIQVPSSVMDLVQARIRDLTDEEKDLLDVACCCGFEFDPGLVAAVVGIPRLPVLKQLARVELRHRLVRSMGRAYAFDHHQVQEALYAGLHEQMREEYHAAIAEALEAREGAAESEPGNLDGALCVDLCEHFLRGANGERALRYLDAALDHLQAGFLNDEAIALADRALALPDLLVGARRLEVLFRKSGHLDLLGRRAAQEALLVEARVLAEASRDQTLLAKVERATGYLFWRLDRYEEALVHHTRALEIAHETEDQQGEAFVTGLLGCVLSSLARYEEARQHHEQHLSLAREIGDRKGEAAAIANLGGVFGSLARYGEAQAHYEQYLVLARELGDRHGEGIAMGNLGHLFRQLGRSEEARAHFEQRLALAREIGDRLGEATAAGGLGRVCASRGRPEEARAQYEAWLAIAREIGDRRGEAVATGDLGLLFLSLGRYEEARAHQEAWLGIAREIGDRRGEAFATGNLGNVAVRLGCYEAARAHYERHISISREIHDRQGEAMGLANRGILQLALGDLARARSELERALTICREIGARPPEGFALGGLAELAHEKGEYTQAADLATQTLALRREIDDGFGVADSLVQLGEIHEQTGDHAASRAALVEAVELLRGQHAAGDLPGALALLACLPDGDVAAAEAALVDAGDASNTPKVRYRLWKATGKHEHLAEAKRLLDRLVEHAPEAYRESMLKNVRLNREILKAWSGMERAE